MATQAKIVIKGKNDITSAVKSASNDLSSLKDSVMKLGIIIKSSLVVTGAVKGIQALGKACRTAMIDEFGASNRTFKQLALALKDKSAFDAVTANLDELCKKTLIANGDLEAMAAELAALGKTPEEINKISNAAVALSNVTGKDLSSSVTTLMNTMNGSTTQLKRMGISLEGVTEEELKQGAAIDVVIAQLGAYSDEMAKLDTSQSLKNISETWGDIKSKIGGILDYNFGPFLANLDESFSAFSENLTNIIYYIGAVMKNFPRAFKLMMGTIWELIKRTFEWDSLKTIFLTAITNITTIATAAIKAVFTSIPQLLVSVVSGIGHWIAYIAKNFQITFLGAIENVINTAGNKIKGTWVGKLFSFDDKLASFSFGTEGLKASANNDKLKADSSFESIGPTLKEFVSDAIELGSTLVNNSSNAFADIYTDIGLDFKSSLDEIVAPTLVDIAAKADHNNQDQVFEQIASNTEPNSTNTELLTQIADASEGTKENTVVLEEVKTFRSLADNIALKMTDTLSSMFGSTERSGFFGLLQEDMMAGFGGLVDSVMPLVSIITQFISPMSVLMIVVQGFVSVLEPAITAVVQPLVDALTWIGEMLASLFLPILDQLYVVFAVLANIIQAVLTPVLQLLAPSFKVIGALLEALSPIIVLVAKVFTIVAAPIQFVADLFSWLGDWIKYCGHAVEVFCYNLFHPFSKRSYGSSPGGFSSDAFSGLGDRLAAIDNIGTSDSVASDSVSTGTAVSYASYSGSTHITINIYQQSPVVGDGGMRTFARMIKNEFLALDYYGVN